MSSVERALPGAVERGDTGGKPEPPATVGERRELTNGSCEGDRIVGGGEQAGASVADELERPAGCGGGGGQPGRSGLEDHLTERVRGAREAEGVGTRVERCELVAVQLAEKRRARRRLRLEALPTRPFAGEHQAGAGHCHPQSCEGLEQHVDPLLGRQPPDEEQ